MPPTSPLNVGQIPKFSAPCNIFQSFYFNSSYINCTIYNAKYDYIFVIEGMFKNLCSQYKKNLSCNIKDQKPPLYYLSLKITKTSSISWKTSLLYTRSCPLWRLVYILFIKWLISSYQTGKPYHCWILQRLKRRQHWPINFFSTPFRRSVSSLSCVGSLS